MTSADLALVSCSDTLAGWSGTRPAAKRGNQKLIVSRGILPTDFVKARHIAICDEIARAFNSAKAGHRSYHEGVLQIHARRHAGIATYGDESVIASPNRLLHLEVWIQAAQRVGAPC